MPMPHLYSVTGILCFVKGLLLVDAILEGLYLESWLVLAALLVSRQFGDFLGMLVSSRRQF